MYGQRLQRAKAGAEPPAQLAKRDTHLNIGQSFQQRIERNFRFQTGQRHAQTVVRTLAKIEMQIRLTRHVFSHPTVESPLHRIIVVQKRFYGRLRLCKYSRSRLCFLWSPRPPPIFASRQAYG